MPPKKDRWSDGRIKYFWQKPRGTVRYDLTQAEMNELVVSLILALNAVPAGRRRYMPYQKNPFKRKRK
jgi:hypothetical protein